MFNNGHTDIKKTAMTAVSVKTSPLLMWLTLMFLLFLPGFLPVKAGLAEKRCNAMSKNSAASDLNVEMDGMTGFSGLTGIVVIFCGRFKASGLYAATVVERNHEVARSLE
jgi:hypothetical protein